MIVQLVVAAGSRKGQILPISTEKFTIGRAEDCHLKSRNELISRYHCAILVGNEVIIRDLGSKNGVRLNGKKINTEHKLQNGDHLVISPLEFYLHIVTDADASGTQIKTSGAEISGSPSTDYSGSEIEPNEVTVLLDHLKSLHKEDNREPEFSETNPLKKIL